MEEEKYGRAADVEEGTSAQQGGGTWSRKRRERDAQQQSAYAGRGSRDSTKRQRLREDGGKA